MELRLVTVQPLCKSLHTAHQTPPFHVSAFYHVDFARALEQGGREGHEGLRRLPGPGCRLGPMPPQSYLPSLGSILSDF